MQQLDLHLTQAIRTTVDVGRWNFTPRSVPRGVMLGALALSSWLVCWLIAEIFLKL